MTRVIYYEHFLGDWLRETSTLSMLEEGAYTRLIDAHYASVDGIEHDRRYTAARATGSADRKAVDTVLARLFRRSADGKFWYKPTVQQAIARVEQRIERAHENGRKGGRPRTKTKPSGFSLGNPEHNPKATHEETQEATGQQPTTEAIHLARYPSTDSKITESEKIVVRAEPDARAEASIGAQATIAMRRAGMQRLVAPDNYDLQQALQSGVTPAELASVVTEFVADGKQPNLRYVLSTAMGRRADAALRRSPPPSNGVATGFQDCKYTGTELPAHLKGEE